MSTQQTEQENYSSKLYMALFPIHTKELPKFLPMAGLIFLTIFSFTMLRNTKDALLLSAPGVVAASLPWAKACIVLPVSILFSMLYVKLKNTYDFEKAYYFVMGGFVSFFALFEFVLFPYKDIIHPSTELINIMQSSIHPVFHNFLGLLGVWSFTMYYVMSELWGTYSLSVLFWQFANDNVSTEESKRFYPLFIMVGNIALLLLSYLLDYISSNYSGGAEIDLINYTVMVAGMSMMLLFKYININVLTNPEFMPTSTKKKKKKQKLSIMDSIKELSQSRYIMYVAILVLSYGVMINIFETVWKEQLRASLMVDGVVNRSALLSKMSQYTFYTGIFTIVLNYLSKDTVRVFGWLTGAAITPIVCTIASLLFMLYTANSALLDPTMVAMGLSSSFAVVFGMYGVIFTKSSKYAFFDPTKEMSFIPISDNLRTSGKAAVDGVGARLGKSGGGLLQMIISSIVTIATGQAVTAIEIAPYLIIILALLGFAWLSSVINLSSLYAKAVEDDEKANENAAPATS